MEKLLSSSEKVLTQAHELKFFVHDEEHTVKADEISPETTLNAYLRQKAHLTGTKNMCFEGGCGSCVVAVTVRDPVTQREVVFAVNSCLVPIYTCSGWKIHTVESIGDVKTGYHPVQKALVQFSGTQCGFCSSGMLMNMYAMYESGSFTMKEIENSFGGNICRCTGYRPILTAFKSLASDASSDIIGKYDDIEDIPICKRSKVKCTAKCVSPCGKMQRPHFYQFGASRWVKVFSINEILDVMRESPQLTYMLVGGNTATGVYKRMKEPDVYIDITSVKDLLDHSVSGDGLTIGADMSLTTAMNLFYKLSKDQKQFAYLKKLGDHIDLIANVPVRNTGTIGGNLFTKHVYHEFPSDVYLMFEAAGALITLIGTDHKETTLNLVDYLKFNMNRQIIKSITLPPLDETYHYESYKIMPRAQNAHALVNAGFLFKLDPTNKVESARIIYGSINPTFIHATNAEKYLVGKQLFSNDTLQGLFKTLHAEIDPDVVLPDPAPEFRRQLAIALCYKFILSITPDNKISKRNKSGGPKFDRPVSTGTQDYETNKSLYPLTKAIPKLEALAQCTGDAQYIMDIPDQPGQLFAAFVLAKAPANSVISKIDTSAALKLDGVVAYYDKKDIPGKNSFTPKEAGFLFVVDEEIFCSGIVKYYFQPVGITVATSQEVAEQAAELVKISYIEGKQKPLLTVRDILKAGAKDKIVEEGKVEAKSKGTDVKKVLKGTFDISWQYHYQMETQCCLVVPVEDGLDMFPATQTMNFAHVAAAKMLDIPANKINISVRRLGGAYGAKVSRNSLISCAAALASHKLRKPVKLWMPLITNMNVVGKRYPFSMDYEVGVNDKGVIQYLDASLYCDFGVLGGNENIAMECQEVFTSIYNKGNWNVKTFSTRSDNHTGTWCRAPGTTEGLASSESIIEHIASSLNLDPVDVRAANMNDKATEVTKYIKDLLEWADVDKRKKEIDKFNKENRWIKKGIAVVPMLYPQILFGNWYTHISIYQGDGSVAISHGGIEMGQGINTKVAQVVAYSLGIPLSQVSVKPSNVLIAPNSMSTGGSLTSEAVCYAALKACNELKERMKPVKEKMKNASWPDLIHQCYVDQINLSASFMFQPTLPDVHAYPIYGATCVEIELDLLTGLYHIIRADIIEDTGDSMSPEIDIGQVEGAFIMGMGYWTSEQIVFNSEGELLTNRTWNYKPPGAKDIPIDFRVKFPKNNPNPLQILHAKSTAESPLCMTCAIPFAIRHAVASARAEADPKAEKWYLFDGPSTVENTFMNCLHDYKQYTL